MINQVALLAMMMKLFRAIQLLSLAWWIDPSSSLCSLILYPRMQGVGITVDCGAQCAITSNFQNYQCAQHLVNELGIQQCNQVQCSPIVYNLSICITEENGITIGDTTTQITIRDGVINETTTRQPQTSSPTTVYRAETTNRIVSYTTKQLSSTEEQLLIGALVGLLVVILVLSTIPWIWTCWKLKVKGLKRDIRQARNTDTNSTTILKMDANPAYESKTLIQGNVAYDNTSEPNCEIIPSVPSQAAYMGIQQPDKREVND